MTEPLTGKELLTELMLRVDYEPPKDREFDLGVHKVRWLHPPPGAIFWIAEQTWGDLWDMPFGLALIELYKMARHQAARSALERRDA